MTNQKAEGQEAASAQAVYRGHKVEMSEVADQDDDTSFMMNMKSKLTTPIDIETAVTLPTVVEPLRVDATAKEAPQLSRTYTSGETYSEWLKPFGAEWTLRSIVQAKTESEAKAILKNWIHKAWVEEVVGDMIEGVTIYSLSYLFTYLIVTPDRSGRLSTPTLGIPMLLHSSRHYRIILHTLPCNLQTCDLYVYLHFKYLSSSPYSMYPSLELSLIYTETIVLFSADELRKLSQGAYYFKGIFGDCPSARQPTVFLDRSSGLIISSRLYPCSLTGANRWRWHWISYCQQSTLQLAWHSS